MRLVEIRVHALPGVDAPFVATGFAPGANVVVGPNASGKSRLVHAVRTLVDPEASRGAGAHVEARFDQDGHAWRATRIGDVVRWERDGEPAGPPAVPAGHLLDGLFLDLEHLLRFGRADHGIADRLATELAGGVDLPRARRELAGLGPRHGASLRTELDETRETLAKVRRRRDALASDEAARTDWEERRARAQAQAASAPLLSSALEVLATRRALASVEARARTFPAGMDALHEGVVQDADALAAAVDRAASEAVRLEAEVVAADDRRAASGLDDDRPDAAQVASWQSATEALAEAERTARDAERRSAEAAGRAAALRRASGPERSGRDHSGRERDEAGVGPTPAELDELDALADEAEAAEHEARTLRRALRETEPAPGPSADPDAARRAVDLLTAWLATPDDAGRWRRRVRSVAYLAAVAGAAGAAWLALEPLDLSAPPERALLLAGASAAVGVAVGVAMDVGAASERRRARRARSVARASLEEGRASPPEAWTRQAVRARLAVAASDAAEARHAREAEAIRAARHVQLRAELEEAELRADRLERRLADRAARAGLAAGQAGRSALERARRGAELREAGQTLHGARQAEAAARDQLERARASLDAELTAAGLAEVVRVSGDDPTATAATLRARLGDLAERVRRRDQAAARRQVADRDRARANEELARARSRRDRLLTTLTGLPPERVARDPANALRELRRRAERLSDWRELRDERLRLGGVLDHHLAVVHADADVRAQVEVGDETGLRHAWDAARAAGERADEATGTIAAIDERLAHARRERDLEGARQVERLARDALEGAYEEVLDAEAATAVLDHLEHAYRSEQRPAALRRAETWFARFTHHAFALAFDASADGAERVHAVDRTDGRRRALDELSSGTKAQLLLALRLAHALEAEQGGPSLPLVLDEALTTSDVGRFAAVAEALTTLTREEGRQVLYLSARPDDAVLWGELAERSDGTIEAPNVLDLAEIRGRPVAPPAIGTRRPAWREPAAPAGLDAASYATALGVAPVDPWRPERIHPLHLLHDRLDLVHALARLRITTVGAASSLLADAPQAERLLGSADRELLAARVAATRAWSRSSRIGRGRMVDRGALTASGTVSAAFLDRVAEVAEGSSGDAGALLAALERGDVKRFREDAREALAAWLGEHGYLDPRAPSTPAERVLAVERALHATSPDEVRDEAPNDAPDDARDEGPERTGISAVALAGWLESGASAQVADPGDPGEPGHPDERHDGGELDDADGSGDSDDSDGSDDAAGAVDEGGAGDAGDAEATR